MRPPSFCRLFFLNLLISILFFVGVQSLSAATWQADFTIRVFSPRTQSIFFSGKFYQKGEKVRIEPEGSDEIDLFDFKEKISIRIFPKDRIYFTKPLSTAKTLKAVKEGWITAPLPYRESSILLWKGKINGKAARLYFMTLEQKHFKSYVLRWLSDDMQETPLRVIYAGPANETLIVDYEPIGNEGELPADYFDPPSDYLSLNPF